MIDGGLIDDGVRDSGFPLIDGKNIDDLKSSRLEESIGTEGAKEIRSKG